MHTSTMSTAIYWGQVPVDLLILVDKGSRANTAARIRSINVVAIAIMADTSQTTQQKRRFLANTTGGC